jgi:methionine sulfoxide reductase catalytic subunit
MLIKRPELIRPSEITPRDVYLHRREFMKAAGLAALAAASALPARGARAAGRFTGVPKSSYSTPETAASLREITTYNNYYEFGTDKESPAEYAKRLRTSPWTLAVEGEVRRPKTYGVEDLVRFPLEERIYRLRCVEGWSLVIPWVGFELKHLIDQVQPTGKAKFVEFVTAHQPENMPGVRLRILDWPYVEGLRMDEAMHPLTILAVGLYGDVLPNQNGAPVRLVVPWKYGFKSGKSLVRLRFVENQPKTAWEKAAPSEYGFYSNVNPDVPHPRWSQATEKRLGEGRFLPRVIKTQIFNGYGDQVARLYAGMDLKRNF